MDNRIEDKIGMLESDNIDDVIFALDSLKENIALSIQKALLSMQKNIEFRPFVAERIYEMVKKVKNEAEALFKQNDPDSDFKFWLSSILLEYDQNKMYVDDLMAYVVDCSDGNEFAGLSILTRKRIEGIDKVVVAKLREFEFNDVTFDRIGFYLDILKTLKVPLPPDIIVRLKEYNTSVKNEWQKLYIS